MILERTERTCEMYSAAVSDGESPTDVVRKLAIAFGVTRPSIYKRLRSGNALPPYRTDRPKHGPRSPRNEARERIEPPKVHRDPCFLCGARGDVGCRHGRPAC